MLTAEEFWEAYCDHNLDLDPTTLYYTVWQFNNGGKGCNRLASLVRAGIKTATTSLLASFEETGDKVPETGDYSIILDTDEEPLFIIHNTNVTIIKFKDIDEEFAFKEGEGDQTLDSWRKIHEEYFRNECDELGIEFSEETELVCEEFEIIFQ